MQLLNTQFLNIAPIPIAVVCGLWQGLWFVVCGFNFQFQLRIAVRFVSTRRVQKFLVLEQTNNHQCSMNLELKLRFAIASNVVLKASSLICNGCLNGSSSPLPLIHAAALGRLEIMTLLVDGGANMDAINNTSYQKTACDAAVRNNQFDALKLLVDRGANVRAVQSADHSLLKAAAQYGDDRMTLLLLDAGAPLNSLTHHDLMNLVASPKSVDVLARLLRRGVDVSALRDIDKNSLCAPQSSTTPHRHSPI
jgi:ankyrin repeat protein